MLIEDEIRFPQSISRNVPQLAINQLLGLLSGGIRAWLFQAIVEADPSVQDVLLRLYRESEGQPLQLNSLLQAIARHDPPAQAAESVHPHGPGVPLLTSREHAVLRLMSAGYSNKEIARDLNIAPETVKSHAKKLFAKLGAQTRAQSVARASRLGLV